MKDQYFGDARDYFKYHLLEELMGNVPGLQRLVCLWMLTPPDTSREGSVSFVENAELPILTAFLRRHLEAGNRRIRNMREYFSEQDLDYIPWGDEPPYFYATRKNYFAHIPDEHLIHALVFIDPDVGLTHKSPSQRHLSFDELAGVFDRMDSESIVVVYQHWVRQTGFWHRRAVEISTALRSPVVYVAEPSVAFYVIPKSPARFDLIEQTLHQVASAQSSRTVGLVRRSGEGVGPPVNRLAQATRVRRQVLNCDLCELRGECRSPVPFRGPYPARIAVVGEAPGAEEDKLGWPFVGRSGMELAKTLSESGVNPDELFFCNACSCYPSVTRNPKDEHVQACSGNLVDQLGLADPYWVLAVGDVAMTALGLEPPLKERRGKVSAGLHPRVFGTYHPAATFYSGKYKREFIAHIKRFGELVSDPEGPG